MTDALLIIGFWLIYIVINTVVSAISKEPPIRSACSQYIVYHLRWVEMVTPRVSERTIRNASLLTPQ